MKTNNKEYDSPYVEVSHIYSEGVLCQSGNNIPFPGDNEDYGGLNPDEEIF